MKNKRNCGISRLKRKYGLIMVSPWIFGVIVFLIFPIIQSAYFSFTEVGISVGGVTADFKGLENYHYIINENPDYIDNLFSALKNMFISLPFILIVSMVLALLLNGNYFGRIFFRGLFFLPAIITAGVVLKLYLTASATSATEVVVSDTVSFEMMFDFTTILAGLNLPSVIETYLSTALSNIFMLVWQSGIQTILFIAGLQSVPDLLYEVSKVEGATKWEEFWYITLPMLGRTILLVLVFTVVDLIATDTNEIIHISYGQMQMLQYGVGSAMLWFYFIIVGVIVSILLFVYYRFFLRRWSSI